MPEKQLICALRWMPATKSVWAATRSILTAPSRHSASIITEPIQDLQNKNYIIPDASSCSEVLYTLLDEAKISREAAECLYTGIVHDTGVFKYNSTTRKTMEIAGALMEKA